jgi:hypothetical protein
MSIDGNADRAPGWGKEGNAAWGAYSIAVPWHSVAQAVQAADIMFYQHWGCQ